MGKNLKPVPEGNKGLKKLPTEVRNKMGFMKKGGQVAGPKGYTKKKKPKSFAELVYSSGDGSEYQKDKVTKSGKRLGGFKRGGQVAGPKKYTRKTKPYETLPGKFSPGEYGRGKVEQAKKTKPYETIPSKIDPKEYSRTREKKLTMEDLIKSGKVTLTKKNKGGLVKGGTSAQMTGKEYKGIF